jgi:PiT family inorganic phosphate transporter
VSPVFLEAVLVIMVFLAVALVSGNNLSACVGPAVGARIISRKWGVLLGAAGFSVGLLAQGSVMLNSFRLFLPGVNLTLQVESLLVAVLVFVVADLIRVPVPLSMCMVGLFAGIAASEGNLFHEPFLLEVIAMWFVAPLAAAGLSFYLVRVLNKSSPRNIWRRVKIYKVVLIFLAFSTSYALGANTIGLIVATGGFSLWVLLTAILGIFVGVFFMSGGELRRVSQELFLLRYPNATVTLLTSTFLVEVATVFNIPLSNTQAISAALFGSGVSYKTKLISLKPFLTIVAGWVLAPVFSFLIGLAL